MANQEGDTPIKESCISEDQRRSSSASIGSKADTCRHCEAILGKRHFNPRHQCRLCCAMVCGSCSPNLVQLDTGQPTQRVCNPCVAIVTQQLDLTSRLDRLARHLRSQAGQDEEVALASRNVEEALQKCESLEPLLAEERLRLLTKVEEAEKIKYFQKLLKTQAEEASKLPEDNHHEERFASSTPERIDFSYKDVAPESAAPGALNGSTATAADSEEVRLQQACKLQLPVESMQSPSTRATSSSPLGGYVASPSGSQRRAEIAAKAREAFQRSPPETPTASPGSRKAGGRRTAQRDNLAERAYQRYQEAWQNDF
ncbi:unnamed protein product [Durusdinium trenchii]|uniref:FYVE-type domain-containing protein n=1 Tax=Durusdinium trenchii TaxID=1381693 RepID=A0ABP0MQ38_9DINO